MSSVLPPVLHFIHCHRGSPERARLPINWSTSSVKPLGPPGVPQLKNELCPARFHSLQGAPRREHGLCSTWSSCRMDTSHSSPLLGSWSNLPLTRGSREALAWRRGLELWVNLTDPPLLYPRIPLAKRIQVVYMDC